MTGGELREALHGGRRVYATSIVSASPQWPDALRNTGIDFVFIDTEHIPRDRTVLSWMCAAYREMGLPPIVRIPSPDPYQACQVLDGGASGIIVPYVESPAEARALAGAVRWRPLKGQRLRDALDDPGTLEPQLKTYLEERNRNNVLIVNIESVPAIEALDDILAVPGLDAVLIGPHDLTCSLGVPEDYQGGALDAAVRTIVGKARACNIGAGVHCFWEGIEREAEWGRAGANLMVHSLDATLFSRALRADVAALREALGDSITGEADAGGVVI